MVIHVAWLVLYIDPGTGSVIWAFIVSTFLGAAYAMKLWWRRIAAGIKRVFRGGDDA